MKRKGGKTAPRPLGRPRTEDRPPGATRAQLLESAAEVFSEQGYVGASISAIADRAGVTSGALYRHFESKADLLLHVVDQAVHGIPLSEKLASGDKTTPRFLSELVSAYAAPSLRRLRRLAIEIHAAASRDKDAAELLSDFNQRTHQALRQRLERCIESGALPAELDARRTASLLLVLVMGLAHLDTLEPTLLGDRAWTRFLERSVERLLRESGSH
jgi:AcrR family transcriptional regulator